MLLVSSFVVTVSRDEDVLLDGTPEKSVQSFIQSIRAENYQAAHDIFSYDMKQDCPVETLAVNASMNSEAIKDTRVTLKNSHIFEKTAVVITNVTQIQSNSPFGVSESSQEHHYTLHQEDGQWKLARPVNSAVYSPWPHFNCYELE